MPHYCIGIDFGTLSARALLVDARTGSELSSGVCDYPHGVMESALPSGEKLGFGWALQDPADYLFALEKSVALALRDAPGCAGDVIGIGIDATACTLLPVTKDGTPLCSFPEYAGVPHAYAKLWQHNAPQRYADRMTELAARRGEPWLFRCGGRVDAQWAVPKLWQALEEAPDVYEAADAWIEAGDWLVWQLCGRKARSASTAGYKALHSKHGGYPSEDYFAALHPGLASVMRDKLSGDVLPVGSKAGELLADMAKR
ncbi:MAG: ribulokinase, partial [Clostridiales bacterium]|nr:ribulokinase [Clostridiales bacterium]